MCDKPLFRGIYIYPLLTSPELGKKNLLDKNLLLHTACHIFWYICYNNDVFTFILVYYRTTSKRMMQFFPCQFIIVIIIISTMVSRAILSFVSYSQKYKKRQISHIADTLYIKSWSMNYTFRVLHILLI